MFACVEIRRFSFIEIECFNKFDVLSLVNASSWTYYAIIKIQNQKQQCKVDYLLIIKVHSDTYRIYI